MVTDSPKIPVLGIGNGCTSGLKQVDKSGYISLVKRLAEWANKKGALPRGSRIRIQETLFGPYRTFSYSLQSI